MAAGDLDLRELAGFVLDSIHSGVMVLDLASHVLSLNAEGERLLDVEREGLMGRAIVEDHRFFPLVLLVNEHRKEGPTHSISRRQLPAEVRRRDGRAVPLSVVVSNLLDGDGVVRGYVLAMRDLTQVRLLQARARRSEELASLGAMAAAMAHEVRNPLHAIHSAAELIEAMSEAGRPVGKYVDAVYQEVAKLERLVQDVLGFARKVELRLGDVDLGDLATETVRYLHVPEELRLEVDVTPGLPRVEADADRLQQVLRNLLRNAVEAQPEGGQVRLSVGPGPRRKLADLEDLEPIPFLSMEVADQGPGISPEDMPHLFEPFFTKRTSGEGTGLGLPICQRIVEAHGGLLEVESRPGEGARFRVLLPVAAGTATIPPPPPPPPPEAP